MPNGNKNGRSGPLQQKLALISYSHVSNKQAPLLIDLLVFDHLAWIVLYNKSFFFHVMDRMQYISLLYSHKYSSYILN
jgi:hypothetical protein